MRFAVPTIIVSALVVALAACDGSALPVSGPPNPSRLPLAQASRMTNALSAAKIAQFHLPASAAEPDPVVVGADGNLWVGAGVSTGRIARVTPAGSIALFALGSGTPPTGMALGPDGDVWFVEGATCGVIGKIDTAGRITRLTLPSGDCGGHDIALGPDGNMWFTDSHAIGRITPRGSVTEFPLPAGEASPYGITAGADGSLWFSEFTEFQTTHHVGKITPAGRITIFDLPGAAETRSIVRGPDGNVYVSDLVFALYRVTPTGVATKFTSNAISYPAFDAMAVGPDNQIWAVTQSGQMEKFDPATGTYSNVINLPSSAAPQAVGNKSIVRGADGDMWFTSGDMNADDYVGVYEF